jgi:hypothetical protein
VAAPFGYRSRSCRPDIGETLLAMFNGFDGHAQRCPAATRSETASGVWCAALASVRIWNACTIWIRNTSVPAICDAVFDGMSSAEQRKDRLIHRSSQKQDSESQG